LIYLYGAIAFVILAMITNYSAGLAERNEGLGPIIGFLVLITVATAMVRANLKKSQRQSKPPRAPSNAGQTGKSPERSEHDSTIDKAAKRIRQLATDFEDKSVEVLFTMEGMQVKRTTHTRTTDGRGTFRLTKSGFEVVYWNLNTKAQKPHHIKKRWTQIAGCLPGNYDLFFGDYTSLTVIPKSNLEDHIYFTVAWQALNSAMNGGWDLFREPESTNIGKRLRQTADYIQANRETVIRTKGVVILDEIGIEPENTALPTMATKSQAPTTGDKIGKWVLGEKLGGPSGQGAVYKTQFEGKGDPYAMKVMQWDGKDPTNDPNFHRSAKSLMEEAKLSMNYAFSPFILGAVHFGLEPWPWVRYPLIQGKTVHNLTLTEGHFEGKTWWNLAHDLFSGLALVHRDGLIHRDIKSDNVMVVGDRAIVLDFGLSEVAGYLGHGPSGGHTSGFAAPEVLVALATRDLKALEHLSPALDVYSAGVLLYFARKGVLPWKPSPGSPEIELSNRLTNPIDLAGFTEIEREILEKMLRIDPSDRPSSRQLLEIAAQHIDIEAKTKLIEEGQLARMLEIGEPDFDPTAEIGDEFEVKGPFESWTDFRDVVREIVEVKKPRYFIVDFELRRGGEATYVQVMKENLGWHAECMSERFSEVAHSADRKKTLTRLGWTPPTGDSPNYIMPIEQNGWEILASHLVDALEQGFEISPSSISSFNVTLQGLGYYK